MIVDKKGWVAVVVLSQRPRCGIVTTQHRRHRDPEPKKDGPAGRCPSPER